MIVLFASIPITVSLNQIPDSPPSTQAIAENEVMIPVNLMLTVAPQAPPLMTVPTAAEIKVAAAVIMGSVHEMGECITEKEAMTLPGSSEQLLAMTKLPCTDKVMSSTQAPADKNTCRWTGHSLL